MGTSLLMVMTGLCSACAGQRQVTIYCGVTHGIEELMIHSKDNIVQPPWGEEMEEALMEQRRRLLTVPSTLRSSHSRVKIAVGIGIVTPVALLGAWALYRLFV